MSNYRKAVEEAVPVRPVIQCAHTGCMQPAMTRDALGANVCRTHWDYSYRLQVRAEMMRLGLRTEGEKRYAISKIAADLAAKKPSKDWAYRLIERAKTESVPASALKAAQEVVDRDRLPMQQQEAA